MDMHPRINSDTTVLSVLDTCKSAGEAADRLHCTKNTVWRYIKRFEGEGLLRKSIATLTEKGRKSVWMDSKEQGK